MFIFIVDSGFIDKYICKEDCQYCSLRFGCYTKEWKPFRFEDDVGVTYERKEIPHIPLNLAYCCRLAVSAKG